MPNHLLDDYLDALKMQLRHLPLAERRKVLSEVQQHLAEDIAGRLKEDPRLTRDEAILQATHAFGDPSDIGVAYGAGGGVVRKSTGEVLLHVAVLAGRGVARTVGATVKWALVATGLLIATVLAIGLILLVAYQPTIDKALDEAASHRSRTLVDRTGSPDISTATFQDSFTITNATVTSDFWIQVVPSQGCMTVTVTGPGNSVVFDSTGNCETQSFRSSFTQPGTYSIQYRLVAFSGYYRVYGHVQEYVER